MAGADDIGECDDCGERRPLGWAHVCRRCWDAFIAFGLAEASD